MASTQLGMLRSHASGLGAPHDEPAVRAIMATMLAALAQGRSGVGVALVQRLAAMLNRGVTPWAPSQGSVGYLTATAHIGLVLFGRGRAWYGGQLLDGAEALRRAGLDVVEPGPREGHALISGTYEITGIGALAAHAARALIDVADVAGALSLEALRGNQRGFDPRVQVMRPHPGQVATAARLRALLEGSEILAANRDHRLQDALSLRSIPQVHGAVRDALAYVEGVIEIEINAVTDNPVFMIEDEELVALPNGNGHGAPTALALDVLAIAIAELSTMSQARSDRLTNQHLSELPAFLVPDGSAASGFMIPPYAAAAIAAENRALAAPATVHTVSTSAGQEDHVSMGTTAAIQARTAAHNATGILAIELLCATQAADFHAPLRPGAGTRAAHAVIRRAVAFRDSDREMAPDIEAVRVLIADGALAGEVARALAENQDQGRPL
ncbi:aromatic amino acid lyase [Microbacterium marinilacus]|nr:aromatic amino acid lyase [Microbacterium marinilacus]